MEDRLRNIEKKLDSLTVLVEHRLTRLETATAGLKWVVATVIAGFGVLAAWVGKN